MKILFILGFLVVVSSVFADENFGAYTGEVKTAWLNDGRRMKLLEDFQFVDANGFSWLAPKDSIVDGASIPPLLWGIIGPPFSGMYRSASVIHDVACVKKVRNWEDVHLAFYFGMRASGVGEIKSKIMYAAVYHFGPRWNTTKKLLVRKAGEYDVLVGYDNPCPPDWNCMSSGAPVYEKKYLPDQFADKLVVAPPKKLSNSDFQRLKLIIKERGISGDSLSIEEIKNFH